MAVRTADASPPKTLQMTIRVLKRRDEFSQKYLEALDDRQKQELQNDNYKSSKAYKYAPFRVEYGRTNVSDSIQESNRCKHKRVIKLEPLPRHTSQRKGVDAITNKNKYNNSKNLKNSRKLSSQEICHKQYKGDRKRLPVLTFDRVLNETTDKQRSKECPPCNLFEQDADTDKIVLSLNKENIGRAENEECLRLIDKCGRRVAPKKCDIKPFTDELKCKSLNYQDTSYYTRISNGRCTRGSTIKEPLSRSDRLLRGRNTYLINPTQNKRQIYKLKYMDDKYTEAMRSGCATQRVYARGLRRQKLQFVFPLSKSIQRSASLDCPHRLRSLPYINKDYDRIKNLNGEYRRKTSCYCKYDKNQPYVDVDELKEFNNIERYGNIPYSEDQHLKCSIKSRSKSAQTCTEIINVEDTHDWSTRSTDIYKQKAYLDNYLMNKSIIQSSGTSSNRISLSGVRLKVKGNYREEAVQNQFSNRHLTISTVNSEAHKLSKLSYLNQDPEQNETKKKVKLKIQVRIPTMKMEESFYTDAGECLHNDDEKKPKGILERVNKVQAGSVVTKQGERNLILKQKRKETFCSNSEKHSCKEVFPLPSVNLTYKMQSGRSLPERVNKSISLINLFSNKSV